MRKGVKVPGISSKGAAGGHVVYWGVAALHEDDELGRTEDAAPSGDSSIVHYVD
jgi:hypothetical protein